MLSGQKKNQFQTGSQFEKLYPNLKKTQLQIVEDMRAAAARGQTTPVIPDQPPSTDLSELNQRLAKLMESLITQTVLLTQSVTALTAAIQENTEAMGGEEEEVVQTGGLLGTASDDEPEAPHL